MDGERRMDGDKRDDTLGGVKPAAPSWDHETE